MRFRVKPGMTRKDMAKKLEKIYPWIVVALLWVVALLNYMDRQMLSTMREYIAMDIAQLQQAEAFGVLMAIFLWIYAIVSPFAGTVADRLSRKWLIVGSLAVWSAVTLLMGYCTTFTQLKWLRGLMGVSEALYIPSSLSLIADYHTGKSRSLAVGIHMTGLYLGQALGGFGANLAAALTWQQTFHWFGIIGIVYAVVLIFCLKEARPAAVKTGDPSVIPSAAKESPAKASVWKSWPHLLQHRLLGHPVLLRVLVHAGLGHEELASDLVPGQPGHPDGKGGPDRDDHHRFRLFHRRSHRRSPV